MARKSDPYDNASAESFTKTLKAGEVYPWEYRTLADVESRRLLITLAFITRLRLPYKIEKMHVEPKNPGLIALT